MTIAKIKLQQSIEEIISALDNLKNDEGVPKNIKSRIENIMTALQEDTEISSKVGKSLQILDEISDDMNIPPFIRTQIWNVSSMLEKLNH
jgi:uncharacterized protein (UPF0147 family)